LTAFIVRGQFALFRATLKTRGDYELREYELDTKDQTKYGVGNKSALGEFSEIILTC